MADYVMVFDYLHRRPDFSFRLETRIAFANYYEENSNSQAVRVRKVSFLDASIGTWCPFHGAWGQSDHGSNFAKFHWSGVEARCRHHLFTRVLTQDGTLSHYVSLQLNYDDDNHGLIHTIFLKNPQKISLHLRHPENLAPSIWQDHVIEEDSDSESHEEAYLML